MAITAGRASNNTAQTVADGTWTDILPTGYNGCEEIVIECLSASAAGVRICVLQRAGAGDSIHRITGSTPDDYAELAAGALPRAFAGSLDNKITRVLVAGDGGTATIAWTVTKS